VPQLAAVVTSLHRAFWMYVASVARVIRCVRQRFALWVKDRWPIGQRRPSVLVIAADADLRNCIVAVLSDAGCVALGVSTPRIAVDLLRHPGIDAILVDAAAAQWLTPLIEQFHPRLIALTDPEQVLDVRLFDGVLVESFSSDDLVRTLRAALERYRRASSL
jgi:DNA-binding response OmpR family regulator